MLGFDALSEAPLSSTPSLSGTSKATFSGISTLAGVGHAFKQATATINSSISVAAVGKAFLPTSPPYVNSIQYFSITISGAATTGTATINPVGSGAFILAGGVNPSTANNPSRDFAYPALTNSTTITATRNSGTGSVTVNGCIVDGNTANLIKSVQYGTVTIASGAQTGTASISTVTNANAAIHLLGWTSANTGYSGPDENPVLSLSGTTATASIADSGGGGLGLVVAFVVIEFQPSALNQSVQNVTATSSSSVTSYTAGITSVNQSNTLSIYAGSQIATVATNFAEIKQYGSLNSPTVFTVNVNTAVGNAKSYNCSIVEFASGVLDAAVQRSVTTLTGATSNTSTLSPGVNAAFAALSWLGNSSNTTATDINRAEGAATLTNGSTVTVTKNNATGNITGSWEVGEFAQGHTAVLTSSSGLSAIGSSRASAGGTFGPHTSLAVTGAATAKGAGTFLPTTTLIAHGSAAVQSAGTFSSSTSLVGHGATISKSTASLTSAASLSASGHAIANRAVSLITTSTFAPTGASKAAANGTFLSASTLSGIGKSIAGSAATISATASLASVGIAARRSAGTLHPSASLAAESASAGSLANLLASTNLVATSKAIAASMAVANAGSSLSARGNALKSGRAILTGTVSVITQGRSRATGSATVSGNSLLIGHGASSSKSAAALLATASLSAAGRKLSPATGAFVAEAILVGTARATAKSAASIAGSSILIAFGEELDTSSGLFNATASIVANGAAIVARTASFNAATLFHAVGRGETPPPASRILDAPRVIQTLSAPAQYRIL